MATDPKDEEYGIHGSTVINAFTVSTERMTGFVLKDKRCDFLPKLIAYPPFTACHIVAFRNYQLRHLTIPSGITSGIGLRGGINFLTF